MRSIEDFNHERQALDAAHAQNEAGRDAFVALAHTALFAASVSFVGDVAPLTKAVWKPMLVAGWFADVVGLLALTFSFGAARRIIDARRAALNAIEAPASRFAEALNGVALWSFPVALLCLFSFVTANVVHEDDRQQKSAPISKRGIRRNPSAPSASVRAKGIYATPSRTVAWRAVQAMDWCHSRPTSAGSSAAPCASTSTEKVGAVAVP